ncbi:MAG TPA: NUDIX domain-containing protein [Thermoleophilaceae bacterium]|nr:NUDIX domain-containing protein [Thermoleophilaceae bacterium]
MKREFSAGGVVVRRTDGRSEMAVISPRRGVLALPKGHPEEGETLEQAATREVLEEPGLTARPRERLGQVRYWYTLAGEPVLKAVTFFMFDYLSGHIEDHDDEVESAAWVPLGEAPRLLSFKGEREMAAKALERRGP